MSETSTASSKATPIQVVTGTANADKQIANNRILPNRAGPTKSGIMLGLGETHEQVLQTLRDLRAHDVEMITIDQYPQPAPHHHPVIRCWPPEEFDALRVAGEAMGFHHVACGPLVRSSYHADLQVHAAGITESA